MRDTGHLSLAEHGAYGMLLDHYYSSMRPLPASLDALCRLCRAMSKPEQAAVKSVAEQFFPIGDDGLRHNHRADIEITKWLERAEQNRERGKLGGRPKANPTGNPEKTQTVSETVSETEPRAKAKPETRNQKPEYRDEVERFLPVETSQGLLAQPGGGEPDGFAAFRAAYPRRSGSHRWQDALNHYRARLREGATHEEILAGANRYAAYVRARGIEGSEHVLQAATFLGKNRGFAESWDLPKAVSGWE